MDVTAFNYNELANTEDNSCIATVLGCIDVTACNYNVESNTDNNSCTYPMTNYDCNNVCLNDEDGDGICDELEIYGCLQSIACNYNADATENEDCIYALPNYDCDGNCLVDTDGDGVCDVDEVLGCMNTEYAEYDTLATDDDGSCATLIVAGCTDPLYLEFDPEANVDDASCNELILVGCMDVNACNYNADANVNDEVSCEFAATYYDCSGDCLVDTDGDGVCDELEIVGCMDITACDYNEFATDAGDCTTAAEYYDCNGDCLADDDGDGVCNELEVYGCTDIDACNFNPDVTEDDGSCYFVNVTLAYDFETPLTATTDATSPTYTWYLDNVELEEIESQLDSIVNGFYEVVVTDDLGCEGSDSLSISTVSITELLESSVSIFPNPVTDVLNISLENVSENISIQVINTLGAEVLVRNVVYKTDKDLQLAVGDLPKGMYLLKINTGSQVHTLPWLKQ